MLPNLGPFPKAMVAEGEDETFELNFALYRPMVDAPLVRGAKLLEDAFGEGEEDFLTLSHGGSWPDGGSLALNRGGADVGILDRLLRHIWSRWGGLGGPKRPLMGDLERRLFGRL